MTIGPPATDPTAAKVERLREALLDLTNRNQLLNFKHSERSRMHIRIIDEVPELLLERLMAGREVRFKSFERPDTGGTGPGEAAPKARARRSPPRNSNSESESVDQAPPDRQTGSPPRLDPVPRAEPRWQDVAASLGIDDSFDLPKASATPPSRHTDGLVQVPHFTDVAEKKLDAIRQTYRTLLEEMGIPALFAAFGFLEWYETPADPDPQFAPLVLLPVEIERVRVGYRYEFRARASDEDPEINLSLQLRLSRMGIELPALDEAGDAEGAPTESLLSAYLGRVEARIRHMPRWRVRRHVTFGILHFARQVMYEDLDPAKWSADGGPGSHPLLPPILGLAPIDDRFRASPVDESFTEHLVTDSDASQRQAIAQALGGASMVIKGPPGTGKSQTITNLIAAALGAGKTVLFIAEKMAALEVVKKRLDDAGLGSCCMELHSTKTKKKEFIDELNRSYDARRDVGSPDLTKRTRLVEEMSRLESEIGAYDQVMATPIGALGMPLKDLIWAAERLRARITQSGQLPDRIGDITISSAAELAPLQMIRDRESLEHLEKEWWAVADSAGKTVRHPWRFVERGSLTQVEQDRLRGATRDWLHAVEALETCTRELPGGSPRMSRVGLVDIGNALGRLPGLGAASPGILSRIHDEPARAALARLVGQLGSFQAAHAALSTLTTNLEATRENAESALPLEEALRGLVSQGESLAQARARLEIWRRKIAKIAESGAVVVELLRRFAPHGAPTDLSPTTVRTTLEMGRCLREIKRASLDLRSDTVVDDGLVSRFAEMAETANQLRREREVLDGKYNGWSQNPASELRQLATVLRTTGLFGRLLGKSYKAARASFLTLTTGRKASRLAMADQLESLAIFIEKWERWPKETVQRLAGPSFRGMDTDFEGLLACSQWARLCGQRLSGLDSRWAVDALHRWPTSDLEVIESSLNHATAEALDAWLEDRPNCELAVWVARKTQQVERAEVALATLSLAGVRASVRVEELPRVHALATELGRLAEEIRSNGKGIEALGQEWSGLETPIGPLAAAVSVRDRIAALSLPEAVERSLLAQPAVRLEGLRGLGGSLTTNLAREDQFRATAESLGAGSGRVWGAEGRLGDALAMLRSAVSTPEHLAPWVAFRRAWDEAIRSVGPRDFLSGLDWSQIPPEKLPLVYELAVYRSLCSIAQNQFPALNRATWSGAKLAAAMARHATLDEEVLSAQREALRFRLAAREVPEGRGTGPRSTGLALIRHEAAKKKRHQSIRQLMKNALDAIQGLKPCFMMSPLSVAQYLETDRVSFDLVVVDEASQMRPAEGLGALLRTRQIVVVGDSQQLPPTSFFDKLARSEDEQTDDDAGREAGHTDSDMESILDLMLATRAPISDLRWHYRSRHESLIAFSNTHFYEGRLKVFPSPSPGREDLGVVGRHVAGLYSESINPIEADAVVEAALDLMRSNPKRSLGIVAMNQKQAELIRSQMDERLRVADSGYEERWKGTLEPFFVKNLESVQGDERDVILVSLTYGPSSPGAKPFQRFGPINLQGGHRRLNVLFTRAKFQLLLFSSMRPEQVEVRETSQRGVRILRQYLEFAFTGRERGRVTKVGRAMSTAPEKGRRSIEHLTQELGQYGLEVVAGVGTQNVELPMAVLHPDVAGAYACLVECDGSPDLGQDEAGFRERTRLVPQMLQNSGWRQVGTWTSDWLRNPLEAHRQLVRGVEGSVAHPLTRRAPEVPSQPVILKPASPVSNGAVTMSVLRSSKAPVEAEEGSLAAAPIPVDSRSRDSVEHLLKRIRTSTHFASARTDESWERLVVPLVALLAAESGNAPLSSVAQALGFPPYRVQGVLAEVQERLNAGQHQVLCCDRDAGQVRLDLPLLEQLLCGEPTI